MPRFRKFSVAHVVLAATSILAASPVLASDDLPYWVSLQAEEANMRVGPSEAYPIDWVYQRAGLPMKVVRKLSGWRLVEDPDGTRGWIVARFLSRERAAIVIGREPAAMRAKPEEAAQILWRAEPGVTGALGECRSGWCRFAVDDRQGWIRETRLWGSGEP